MCENGIGVLVRSLSFPRNPNAQLSAPLTFGQCPVTVISRKFSKIKPTNDVFGADLIIYDPYMIMYGPHMIPCGPYMIIYGRYIIRCDAYMITYGPYTNICKANETNN